VESLGPSAQIRGAYSEERGGASGHRGALEKAAPTSGKCDGGPIHKGQAPTVP